MATTPTSLSPLPSRTEGLGIFPSGDSFNRDSVYSKGHARTSTCALLSFDQPTTQEQTPSPARSTMVRAPLKEIEKSPVPHRFNLVPFSKKRVPAQPSNIPRSPTQWKWKERREGVKSGYSARSPSLYDSDADPQSPESTNQGDEEKRSVIEDLLSDAFDSPVFDCIAAFGPPSTSSPQRHTVSPPSFTLVQDQPNRKSQDFSTAIGSIQVLSTSGHSLSSSDSQPQLPLAFPSPQTPVARLRDDAHFYQDHFQSAPLTLQDDVNTHYEWTSRPTSTPRHSFSHSSSPSQQTASSTSISSAGCAGSDTSGSHYSQASLRDSLEIAIGAHQASTTHPHPHATSRRATDGGFASLTSSDSRRRKFAVRRQAVYGINFPFPQSDSSSSVRHTHVPTSSSRDGFPNVNIGPGRTASYMTHRSAWSASTLQSAASVRSYLQNDASTEAVSDDDNDNNDDGDDDEDSGHLVLPYPSSRTLASLATNRLEPFTVQHDLLSSSRNPLLDNSADLMTSTPPPRARTRGSQRSLHFDLASLAEVPGAPLRVDPRGGGPVHSCGFEFQPWAPLQIVKTKFGIRLSKSSMERAQMLADSLGDPGHHPIIEELLEEVYSDIREWKRQPVA